MLWNFHHYNQRARGSVAILSDYAPFGSDAELLLVIKKERRTERAKAVMTHEQKEQTGFNPTTWSNNMLLFPIPLQVIQSNPEKIKQNSGY